MGTCDADSPCIHADVDTELVPEFLTREIGIPVMILNSVHKKTCKHCGEVLHQIQYPDRLTAAAAVTRVQNPMKLSGDEIKFLRKAVKRAAVDLAKRLEVKPETLSRWENDKLPMGPAYEKLLRLLVGVELLEKAPAIRFDANHVVNMAIKGVRNRLADEVMVFQLVTFQAGIGEEPAEEYSKRRAA